MKSPLTFEPLSSYPELIHGFTLRSSPAESSITPAPDVLIPFGHPSSILIQAEQPHGNRVKSVDGSNAGTTITQVDGLVTATPGILLVIRTADCGALFLYDPEHRAVGIAHSGKKGTEANITKNVISAMAQTYQTDPAKVIAVLGPCIRPPHYEINFAQTISEQAYAAGIENFTDSAANTATDLERYFSYRMEKGKTGRHYAFIGVVSG